MNLLEFLVDTQVCLLELLHLLEDFLTLATAGIYECVCRSPPVESLNTRFDGPVKAIEVLLEEELLLVGDGVHDGVVVTDDKHDILTKNSQLLLLAQELRDSVGYRDVTKGLDLGPVLHFNDDLE